MYLPDVTDDYGNLLTFGIDYDCLLYDVSTLTYGGIGRGSWDDFQVDV